MTLLGEYLAQRAINKAEVARKTGISKARLSELTLNSKARLTAEELYLIALSINVSPNEVLTWVCRDIKLKQVTEEKKTD